METCNNILVSIGRWILSSPPIPFRLWGSDVAFTLPSDESRGDDTETSTVFIDHSIKIEKVIRPTSPYSKMGDDIVDHILLSDFGRVLRIYLRCIGDPALEEFLYMESWNELKALSASKEADILERDWIPSAMWYRPASLEETARIEIEFYDSKVFHAVSRAMRVYYAKKLSRRAKELNVALEVFMDPPIPIVVMEDGDADGDGMKTDSLQREHWPMSSVGNGETFYNSDPISMQLIEEFVLRSGAFKRASGRVGIAQWKNATIRDEFWSGCTEYIGETISSYEVNLQTEENDLPILLGHAEDIAANLPMLL